MEVLPYVAPLVLAAVMCSFLILVAVPQRALPGVRWFLVFMAGLVVWSGAYAAELLVPGVEQKLLTAKIQYLGIAVIPVAWLVFAAKYSDLPWWSSRSVVAAFVLPVATVVIAWTNEAHGLLWASIDLNEQPGYSVLEFEYGVWFWINVGYAYLCLLLATGLIVRVMLVRPRFFRGQALTLTVASLAPWLGNVLYVTRLNPTALDLTVFGFTITGFGAAWAVLRRRFLSTGPIGREVIVQGMAGGVVVIDQDGRIVDVNPSAARILETTSDRLIGGDAKKGLGRFAPEMNKNTSGRHTVTDSEGVRSYDCEVAPLHDRQGHFRGWTFVLHDATVRVAEAMVLERARRVAEHTAALQRAFMANINHEIRTPLNGVLGMLEVLRTTRLDAQQREYAEMAAESGSELLQLVDRILDFTVIEKGEVQLAEDPFELDVVVRDAMEASRPGADQKGLDLRMDLRTVLPGPVLGDPRRLAQVVTALVDNAVKFTDSGGVVVQLAFHAGSGDDARVRVEVQDTGVGIPEHRMEEIFQDFLQVDGSTTRRYGGVGLGLTMTRRLLNQMGGELEVRSVAGAGSSFWFVLPLKTLPTPTYR